MSVLYEMHANAFQDERSLYQGQQCFRRTCRCFDRFSVLLSSTVMLLKGHGSPSGGLRSFFQALHCFYKDLNVALKDYGACFKHHNPSRSILRCFQSFKVLLSSTSLLEGH